MIKTCIIGETDPFIARLLQRYAEASGLHSQRAQVGEEVLSLAREVRPAVIILEPELPGKIRGWEAAHALQADDATHDIPIISCSWLPVAEANALIGKIIGHLQKPELHYEDFVESLHAAGIIAEQPITDQTPASQAGDVDLEPAPPRGA